MRWKYYANKQIIDFMYIKLNLFEIEIPRHLCQFDVSSIAERQFHRYFLL